MKLAFITIILILIGHCAILGDGQLRGDKAVSLIKHCLMVNNVNDLEIEKVKRKSVFTTIIDIEIKNS